MNKKVLERVKEAKEYNSTSLDLSNLKLTEIPRVILKLPNLKKLTFADNKIREIPDWFSELINLEQLSFANNEIVEIPKSMSKLKKLEVLYLDNNKIKSVPEEIVQLKKLKNFWLNMNNSIKLPNNIGNLKSLETLNLEVNKLDTIPNSIGNLKNLRSLNIQNNNLKSIPPEVGTLSNLKELNLSNNDIETLPEELMNIIDNLEDFSIKDNKIDIPPEIEEKSNKDNLNYALQQQDKNSKPLNEAKVLIVGQGGVGKTSLLNALFTKKKFNPNEKKTNGIDIRRLNFNYKKEKYKVNFWDFGGQEIMHSTHQFFLTERSLYILVWDARAEDDRYGIIEYWLEMIESYGEHSPIFVVMNKVDEHNKDLDKRYLKNKYPNIVGFYKTSCQENIGISELAKDIMMEITQLRHIKTKWSEGWFKIKNYFEKVKEAGIDYIEYEDYVKIAQKVNIADENNQKTLIKFLHDLGIVINFQDNSKIKHVYIVNPEWITDAIYKIINYPNLIESKGVLTLTDLYAVLPHSKYPQNKVDFIIDMMEKFELSFEHSKDKYLIPEALPDEKPDVKFDKANSLGFQYKYNFLPSSIMSRFIVKSHFMISNSLCWKNQIVLEKDENRALIECDIRDKVIFIYVEGELSKAKEFLEIIREFFEEIHKSIKTIRAEAQVPIMSNSNIKPISYKHLLNLEKLGQKEFLPDGAEKLHSVSEILSNVDVPKSGLGRDIKDLIKTIENSKYKDKGILIHYLKTNKHIQSEMVKNFFDSAESKDLTEIIAGLRDLIIHHG